MTPRDQIQEHAKTAAAKIREALQEFTEATGLPANVNPVYVHYIEDDAPRLIDVCVSAEVRGGA